MRSASSPRPQPTLARSVDSDVDLHDPGQRDELAARPWLVLASIAIGGVLGTEARAVVTTPDAPLDAFPSATVLVNVTGSLLIGVLMATLAMRPGAHPLARPFLGVGVLGGFTTFSTYAVDVAHLIEAGRVIPASATVVLTPVLAIAAAWVGARSASVLLAQRAAGDP